MKDVSYLVTCHKGKQRQQKRDSKYWKTYRVAYFEGFANKILRQTSFYTGQY